MVALPLPFGGRRSGRNRYETAVFRGSPEKKIKGGCSRGRHKWSELLCNPYGLVGPSIRGQKPNLLHHPCLLWGLELGGNAMLPVLSRSPQTEGQH